MDKILFVFEGVYNGGTEVATINLIKKLNKKNYDCFYTFFDKVNSDKDIIAKFNNTSKEVVLEKNKKYDYDYIIFCTSISICDNVENIFNNVKRKKIFFWFHYFWEDQINFLNEYGNKIDKIIAVSNSCKNKLEKEYGITKVVQVITNIFDIGQIKSNSLENIEEIQLNNIKVDENNKENKQQKNKEEKKKLNLLSVGRIAPIKGYDKLEEVSNILKNNDIEYDWYILGKSNPYEKEFNEKINKLINENKNIHILGHKDNPYKYMKNVDYVMVISKNETWSLVITEAKILGIPCISTNFDAVYEQIENNVNGYIFDINNLETFDKVCKDIKLDKYNVKYNLKKFKYDNEKQLNKWIKLLK